MNDSWLVTLTYFTHTFTHTLTQYDTIAYEYRIIIIATFDEEVNWEQALTIC